MPINSTVEPGFCVVQQPGTLAFHAQDIFHSRNPEAAKLFMQLNNDTQWVKPGQILIVADPENKNQQHQIRTLQAAKGKVNLALATTDTPTASFINDHYAVIAALTSWGDKASGMIGDAGEKYFSQIESTLKRIEQSYQNQFRTQGSLISQQFFAERQALFAELKPLLNSITRLSLKLKKYDSLKTALGLSSRSIVHDWQTAGVGAIKGYSSYIERAAGIAKYMKAGGWVAIGFAGLNTTNEVHHACTTGREGECRKVAVREYTKFGVSTGTGYLGGAWGAAGAGAACVALGVATAGAGLLACSVLGAAAGGYVGSEIGSSGTDYMMDKLL
ncbi:hypothetical protein [Erwinia mallotivora]|uniref:Membrane protein n=1 Tax=Erwinia mallotivora TaxID=69222 RepID=A0A014LXY2_9GAMM|nr:hypothetical protein [Erwinia mallotivora]EXU74451.1 membrane protein [Erwinia mallotivora]